MTKSPRHVKPATKVEEPKWFVVAVRLVDDSIDVYGPAGRDYCNQLAGAMSRLSSVVEVHVTPAQKVPSVDSILEQVEAEFDHMRS